MHDVAMPTVAMTSMAMTSVAMVGKTLWRPVLGRSRHTLVSDWKRGLEQNAD